MNDIFDNIYGIIFSPRETFQRLFQNPQLSQSLLIVIIVSIITPLLNFEFRNEAKYLFILIFSMFGSALGGIISWLFFTAFIELIASIFKQSGKFKNFLCLSAFALIPWIFIAPAELLKLGGIPGGILGILIGLGIWVWVTVLIIMALMQTYNLSFGRSIVMLISPFVASILSFNWTTGFFVTLFRILKI